MRNQMLEVHEILSFPAGGCSVAINKKPEKLS